MQMSKVNFRRLSFELYFRLHFQFRVDNEAEKFIDIEKPAHQSSFHHLSLNIQKQLISGMC